MKKFILTAVAVLATVSFAHGYALQLPANLDTGLPGPGKEIVLSLTGADTDIQGATLNLVITGGVITGLERKAGTIFEASGFNVDDPIIYPTSDGFSGVNSDFGMPPGAFASVATNGGVLAVLTIDTAGLAPGVYELRTVSVDAGPTQITNTELGTQDIDMVGTFVVTPEPAALALLGLGGLFIRRRRA